jgi:hypothetical protein
MKPILEMLAHELERPRELPSQVANHLATQYAVERENIGDFLVRQLGALEDYEIDLILSPVFTPAIYDQAVFAGLLGAESVSADQQLTLIQELVKRPTRAHLLPGGEPPLSVPLREVTIERYVRRLRLNGTISTELLALLSHLPPAADRPLLKAVARRAIWEREARRQILVRYLTVAAAGDDYRLDDVLDLLQLMETYEPTDTADLLARIPHWLQVLRHEVSAASNPRPFFNERVQELHGGGRDQRATDDARISARHHEMQHLERLRSVLSASHE